LKICPNCRTENTADGAVFCLKCGKPLDEANADSKPDQVQDLEFTITETPGAQAPDILGSETSPKDSTGDEDELEIASSASLLEESSTGEIDLGVESESDTGLSDPSLIVPELPKTLKETITPKNAMPSEESKTPTEPKADTGKLSDEEVAAVKKNLYATEKKAPKLPGDKKDINHPIGKGPYPDDKKPHSTAPDSKSTTIRPIDDPAQKTSSIKKTQRVRGIALFRKNTIKVVGNPFLHEGDELVINKKPYLLRPWKADIKLIIGSMAAIFVVILIIIGIKFANQPAISGEGEIVGMILDENGRPYLEKSIVAIPLLNKSTSSNAQGFFRFQKIPTGTYELMFEKANGNIYEGNATVISNQLTLMAFGEQEPVMPQRKTVDNTSYTSDIRNETHKKTEKNVKAVTSEKKKKSDSGKKSSNKYGKIKLKANVENARVSIDNKTLGAGNNTYSKIKPGTRTVKVSKDGYTAYKEVVKVKAGKTTTITANLAPAAPASLSAKDYLSLGKDALKENDYSKAINNLTMAVELSPNLAEAYEARATASLQTGEENKAVSDYIRAGEIYRFKKKYDESNNAFSLALELSEKNTNALIGRAGTYCANGKYRSAMKDYDAALKTNNKLFAAQYGMGICYFKLGENKKAEKYLKSAYKLDKSDPQLYQYLMLNYLARDNIKKVREVYSEFKTIADPAELAELKSSNRFQPVIRLIKEENR